jgi:hypothetical protein
MADLVGQLAAAPRHRALGFLDGAAQAFDDFGDLLVHVGDLAFGGVRLQDVNQLVRTFHTAPYGYL